MKPYQKYALLILGALLFTLALLSFYNRSLSRSKDTQFIRVIPTIIPSASAPTATLNSGSGTFSLKSYRNDKIGFSFDYPKDLTLEKRDNDTVLVLKTKKNVKEPGDDNLPGVEIRTNANVLSYLDSLNKGNFVTSGPVKSFNEAHNNINFAKIVYSTALSQREELLLNINSNLVIINDPQQIFINTFNITK